MKIHNTATVENDFLIFNNTYQQIDSITKKRYNQVKTVFFGVPCEDIEVYTGIFSSVATAALATEYL